MTELKHTPLYDYFNSRGIRLVDFGGWAMPVQFSKIGDEHQAVRQRVGLFDCSHMGEIMVSGEAAAHFLNTLCTNNTEKIQVGQAQYNLFCTKDGGVIDDTLIYRLGETSFMVVPNAGNLESVYEWLKANQTDEVIIDNQSDQTGLIALQGPRAVDVLKKVGGQDALDLRPFRFIANQTIAGVSHVLVSRTGYTGEDGFELYIPAADTVKVWEALLAAGQEEGIAECGLGSRDTLRLEAGLPLYGNEFDRDRNPVEFTSIGFALKVKKATAFIGQDVLKQAKEEGADAKIYGFELVDRGIPRHGYEVVNASGDVIGEVTSGTQSPSLGKSIGYARIRDLDLQDGDEIYIQVRKKRLAGKLIPLPFYQRS